MLLAVIVCLFLALALSHTIFFFLPLFRPSNPNWGYSSGLCLRNQFRKMDPDKEGYYDLCRVRVVSVMNEWLQQKPPVITGNESSSGLVLCG